MIYCGNTELPSNWEHVLEMLLLKSQYGSSRRKAYICSPCRADSIEKAYANIKAVRFYMYFVYTQLDMEPCAPHAYVPVLLSDLIDEERDLALKFGKELLTVTSEVLVCGQRLTIGMLGELERAAGLNIPITIFDPSLFKEVESKFAGKQVQLYHKLTPLALNADELFTTKER